jgi:hypothetical protein
MTTTALSRDELKAQISNIEARIAKLGGFVDAGDEGEDETLVVRRGHLVPAGRNRVFLNINRRALADRKAKLAALEGGR